MGQCILPRLGGQHFNALGQQHGGFALHLGLVLQVFNGFHAFSQRRLQTRQRLAGQRCTGFGCVALPTHGIAQVDMGGVAQGFAFGRPLHNQSVLVFAATQLVEFLAQNFGSPLVAMTHFVKNGLDLGQGRLTCQPIAQACGAVCRGRNGEGPASQMV